MENIGIIKVSSKGQIVIPQEMRNGLNEGDKLLIIQKDGNLILKKATNLDENFKEDLDFAKRTEEAYKRHERGEFVKMDFDEFIKKMEKW